MKQASIGTSKMNRGMELNDGLKMDQEWNQLFEMMERDEVSDFVVKPSLKFARAPPGPLAGSTENQILQTNFNLFVTHSGAIVRSRTTPNHFISHQRVMSRES